MEQQIEIIEEINPITPNPSVEMTEEQRIEIEYLLLDGIYPREIFINYNYPLEWATLIEQELLIKATENNE